jgi:hypothetical protein
MRNNEFESAFRDWFNSLSPEEQDTQREDIWVNPLLHILKENVKEATLPKETKTTIVSITKDELIKKIGNALLEIVPCSWDLATTKITQVSSKLERENLLSGLGATQAMVKRHLSEYIRLEGKAMDTTVHRAQPDEEE